MDFIDMGQLDARTEIEKGAIHSADVKGATVRLSNDFLELLNPISNALGLSRQAFMSKIIEVYAPQAFADYIAGYGGYVDNDAKDFFKKDIPSDLVPYLDAFVDKVNNIMIDDRAYIQGIKVLPKDDPAKLAYLHKQRRLLQQQYPDATFMAELPALEGDK